MFSENEFDDLCHFIQNNHEKITTNYELLRSMWNKAGQLGVFDNSLRENSIKILDILIKYNLYDFPFWLQRDVLLPLFEKNATSQQKALYLDPIKKGEMICALAITEETGGSSFDNITSKVLSKNDIFTITCKKNVVTNAMIADLFFLITRNSDEDLCAFIIDKSKDCFSVFHLNTVSEINGLAIGILECNNLKLDQIQKLGASGSIQLSLTNNLAIERFCCAKLALGICRKLYTDAVKWLKYRDPNHRYSSIWFELSDYYAELHHCILMENEIQSNYLNKHNLFYSAARFKYSVMKLLLSMSSSIARISGCYSIDKDAPLETISYTNLAHAYAAAGGTQEVMLQILDRYIHTYI